MIFSRGELCGVFPLVYTGKAMVSLPHFSYGGVLLKEAKISINIEEVIEAVSSKQPGYYSINTEELVNEKCNTSRKIFIRSFEGSAPLNAVRSQKVTCILRLPESSDELFENLSSNLRRKIKKAQTSGLVITVGGKQLLVDFYKVYAKNIYQLNSLNYSLRFFNDLIDCWEHGDAKLFVAYSNGIPIGSSMLASYNRFYENTFFATMKGNRKEYVSDLLHWKMINFCIESENNKLKSRNAVYSFGRSTKDSGVYNYKNHWPVHNYPLYNYSNIPDLRRNDWMLKIWRLLPEFVTKPLGAKLIKHIY